MSMDYLGEKNVLYGWKFRAMFSFLTLPWTRKANVGISQADYLKWFWQKSWRKFHMEFIYVSTALWIKLRSFPGAPWHPLCVWPWKASIGGACGVIWGDPYLVSRVCGNLQEEWTVLCACSSCCRNPLVSHHHKQGAQEIKIPTSRCWGSRWLGSILQ